MVDFEVGAGNCLDIDVVPASIVLLVGSDAVRKLEDPTERMAFCRPPLPCALCSNVKEGGSLLGDLGENRLAPSIDEEDRRRDSVVLRDLVKARFKPDFSVPLIDPCRALEEERLR
jgi:hypothetical protein